MALLRSRNAVTKSRQDAGYVLVEQRCYRHTICGSVIGKFRVGKPASCVVNGQPKADIRQVVEAVIVTGQDVNSR